MLPRLLLLGLLLGLGLPAQAQQITNPAPVAGSGAYNASPKTCTDGQFCFMQTDVNGILKTVQVPSVGGGATNAATSVLASNLVVKSGAGTLFGIVVSADSTISGAAWWIMVFDATSLPSNGTVTPAKCYALPSGATSASYAWPIGLNFTTGITVGASTTGCFSLTASVHAFIAADYK